MKQVIIATITIVGVGTATFIIVRSSKRKTHKPMMTFAELYDDNLCSENNLFD